MGGLCIDRRQRKPTTRDHLIKAATTSFSPNQRMPRKSVFVDGWKRKRCRRGDVQIHKGLGRASSRLATGSWLNGSSSGRRRRDLVVREESFCEEVSSKCGLKRVFVRRCPRSVASKGFEFYKSLSEIAIGEYKTLESITVIRLDFIRKKISISKWKAIA